MPDTAQQVAATYPMPTYRFMVTVGNDQMAFSAVSGLERSVELIQYRDGLGGIYQMPGQHGLVSITLRRGMVARQSQLHDWFNSINFNQVDKRDISVSLTNDAGTELLVTWNISNAFPTKLTAPSLDATSNEVAIEEITLAADRLSVKYH